MISYSIVYPFTIIHIVTTILHFFFCWLLIERLEYGITGAGCGLILTEVFNLIGLGGIAMELWQSAVLVSTRSIGSIRRHRIWCKQDDQAGTVILTIFILHNHLQLPRLHLFLLPYIYRTLIRHWLNQCSPGHTEHSQLFLRYHCNWFSGLAQSL